MTGLKKFEMFISSGGIVFHQYNTHRIKCQVHRSDPRIISQTHDIKNDVTRGQRSHMIDMSHFQDERKKRDERGSLDFDIFHTKQSVDSSAEIHDID